MRSPNHERLLSAFKRLDQGVAKDALDLGSELLKSQSLGDQAEGHMCCGTAYEQGGDDLAIDLDKAIHSYRLLTLMAPSSIAYCYLARACMKTGSASRHEEAFRHLTEAERLDPTAVVHLGFATYYRGKKPADLPLARSHYLKAAIDGRFKGMFGYSELSREMGQRYRAFVADAIRISAGWLIALLIGQRAMEGF